MTLTPITLTLTGAMSLVTLFRWRAARVQAASYPPCHPLTAHTPLSSLQDSECTLGTALSG